MRWVIDYGSPIGEIETTAFKREAEMLAQNIEIWLDEPWPFSLHPPMMIESRTSRNDVRFSEDFGIPYYPNDYEGTDDTPF